MEDIKAGMLAVSKAGHDKGKAFVVVRIEGGRIWVADGEGRTVEEPKQKNRKHLQPVKKEAVTSISNEKVKEAIQAYRRL